MIRIRLLGRFAVDRDGQEIAPRAFGGRLARRLLRLLALRRGTLVSKDVIADALWPENPPADAPGNIEILVSRIRRALGDRTLIRTGPGGYVLADGDQCRVDAEEFLAAVQAGRARLAACPAEALTWFRAALSIWGGEPLPEDTYADWAQADRRQLLMGQLEALDGAAAAALDSDNAAAAAEAAAGPRRHWRPNRCANPRCCFLSGRSRLPETMPEHRPPSTNTGTVSPPRPAWSPRSGQARSASASCPAGQHAADRTSPLPGCPPGHQARRLPTGRRSLAGSRNAR